VGDICPKTLGRDATGPQKKKSSGKKGDDGPPASGGYESDHRGGGKERKTNRKLLDGKSWRKTVYSIEKNGEAFGGKKGGGCVLQGFRKKDT